MARLGRPKKAKEDLVQNQLIAVDKEDYLKLKNKSIKSKQPIKVLFKELVSDL